MVLGLAIPGLLAGEEEGTWWGMRSEMVCGGGESGGGGRGGGGGERLLWPLVSVGWRAQMGRG